MNPDLINRNWNEGKESWMKHRIFLGREICKTTEGGNAPFLHTLQTLSRQQKSRNDCPLCNHEITIVDLEHSRHDSRHIMRNLNGLRCRERNVRHVNDQFYVRSSIRIVGTMSSKRLKPERNSGSRGGGKLCDRNGSDVLAPVKRPIQCIR